MATADIVAALKRAVIFSELDQADLTRLSGIAREVNLSSGDTLFEQGDESDGLYVIVSGILRVYLTADDKREGTINLLEGGEAIGEVALIDGLPRSTGAAALTDAKVIFIPREPFLNLLEESRTLAGQTMLTLCERLRAADAQVDQMMFHDLRHRLLVLLHQLAIIHGHVERDVAVVDLHLTQGTLAQMLGASRETVNKQLRGLAKEGRLEIEGPRIRVLRTAKG